MIQVAAQDDYKCAVSGIFDIMYWGRGSGVPIIGEVCCAHILKRVAGLCADQTVSIIFPSFSLMT